MLNRTNRTLSANLNRLNLGTRSLAIAVGVNNGGQTLRTRHAHRFVKRDGMPGYPFDLDSISISRGTMPAIPGPSSAWPRPEVSVSVVEPTVVVDVRPGQHGEPCDQTPWCLSLSRRSTQRDRESLTSQRLHAGFEHSGTQARLAVPAAAALFAASAG